MSERLRHVLPVAIGLIVFLAALEVLRTELAAVSWHELTADVLATAPSRVALAVLLTALNYVVLAGYDLLAFAYVGNPLSRVQVALTSMLSYAISNNIGFAMLSGASIRYRFYTRWGVTTDELSRIVFSYSVTFWLGLLALGGLSLVLSPLPSAHSLPARMVLVPVGWVLMLAPLAYLGATTVARAPLHIGRFELPLPSWQIAVGQLVVSAIDWALAGAVLYALLPPSGLTFLAFLGAFLIAILLGMVSHVPGGVGVFEGLMVLLLSPYLASASLVPALVVFRAVYYLLPLAVGLLGLVADELWLHRRHLARARLTIGRLTEGLSPVVLSGFTFAAGLVLLFSSATPAAPGRLELLAPVLPLAVIETSHFLGSVVGTVLLILSQGLARRLDASYYATCLAIVTGMVASLLKGFDYEEAMLLAVVLAVLWRARPAFDRRAAFLETRFAPGWTAAVLGAVAASVWLGLFSFKHVAYSQELWWQFELQSEASRFLRASVGAALVLLVFGIARLTTHAPHEAPEATEADLQQAAVAIAEQTSTMPLLVYLRDKALLFNEAKTAFIMYGVQGRTWTALGDPVGPERDFPDLMRRFVERCDDFGGVPVFYEVGKQYMHHYADLGFAFVKLGEEARVDLTRFSLEGRDNAKLRQAGNRVERDGDTFRVLDAGEAPARMAELRAVSTEWLETKAAAEKGFSLGFFDERYVARFPVAVLERGGRILAFATLWPGPGGEELSVDLMRHRRDAPNGVMDSLFVQLMLWGRDRGYRWFGLGMAPLAGVEASPIAPLWNRIGDFLYEHGRRVYSFQGLRAYKEKFHPRWEPRYLAYPRGLHLPRVLADVAALVAGGYRQILTK